MVYKLPRTGHTKTGGTQRGAPRFHRGTCSIAALSGGFIMNNQNQNQNNQNQSQNQNHQSQSQNRSNQNQSQNQNQNQSRNSK